MLTLIKDARLAVEGAPLALRGSVWEGRGDLKLEERWFPNLKTRSRNILFRTLKAKTFADLLSLDAERIMQVKNSGLTTCRDLIALRNAMYATRPDEFEKRLAAEKKEAALEMKINPVDPAGYDSFADFVVGAADDNTKSRMAGNWAVVLHDYLALGECAEKKTLEEVGSQLRITRERVRQIGIRIEHLLFGEGRAAKYALFVECIEGLFEREEWILSQEELLAEIKRRFSWQSVSIANVVALMKYVGHEIETESGTLLCSCDFDRHVGARYELFLGHVNTYRGALKGYSLDGVRGAVSGLSDLKENEYSFFVRRGMRQRMIRKIKANKVLSSAWIVEIKSLRARQYFAHVFNLPATTTKRGYNKGTVRKDVILGVLMKAGPQGLTTEDILERCKIECPTLDWGLNNVRVAANKGVDLDDAGSRMIGYDRGSKIGGRTRYTLNTFFQDAKTVAILRSAAKEIGDYMRATGFGVVSVWKWWKKYRKSLPIDLPKLGFYMMMREIGAGGLEYLDYPKISMRGMDVCENVYGWELYQYFLYCGKQEAMFGQIMSFFVDCLGLQPSIAEACAFQSMGLEKVEDELTAPYKLRRPDKPMKTPRVLLGTVKRDPALSLIRSSDKFTIHADYFDDDGRALNYTTYVRMFMRALEKVKFKFSDQELAMLMDRGWSKVNLKIPRAMLAQFEGYPPRGCGYWKERFMFGGEAYFVCGDWEQKNKAPFDKWAARIAKMAGVEFEPYEVTGIATE